MVKCNRKLMVAVFAAFLPAISLHAVEYSLAECQAKAAQGVAEAQWQLGQRYENGIGVKKSGTRALAQYRKAAEQKHRKACERLAAMYENGEFVKKDPVLAAQYKAWANGENSELAVSQARISAEKGNVDEIETALDYILGRNGKAKDPKTGIRILYSQAKDKPVAQRVFVERWSKGNLDNALDVLDDEEWGKILPWFKNAWDAGNKATGLVLGNDAYSHKQYSLALQYWMGSGVPKAWYFVGLFYDSIYEEGEGGGPSSMRDETKARKAYEKCLKLDGSYDVAKYNLGFVYLFAEKRENKNLIEAKKIFAYFLKKDLEDMWNNWNYGLSGYLLESEKFEKKWSKSKVKSVLSWAESNDGRVGTSAYDVKMLNEFNRISADWQATQREQESYVTYIKKAAKLGCESAQKFMSDYNSKKH